MRTGPEPQNIPAPKSAFHEQIKRLVSEHSSSVDAARAYLAFDYSGIEQRILSQLTEVRDA